MARIQVRKSVDAPLERVWAAWDDYGNIAAFNSNLRGSHLLPGGPDTGTGALRQCDMADGRNFIRERITGYDPGRRMVLDIYEGTLPFRTASATLDFDALTPATTEVTMTLDFTPKYGHLGRLMVPIITRKFGPALQALLDGNAAYVERGERARPAA